MKRDEILSNVYDVLSEIQTESGRPVDNLSGGLCPVGGLAGFDSLNAFEASAHLSERCGCEIEADVALFCRPIEEIVEEIYRLTGNNNEHARP